MTKEYDLTLSGDLYNSTASGYQIGGDYNREAKGKHTFTADYVSYAVTGASCPLTFDIYCSSGAPPQWDSSYAIRISITGNDPLDLTKAAPYESLGGNKYRYTLYDIGTFSSGNALEISLKCYSNGEYPISQYARPAYLVGAKIICEVTSSDKPYLRYNGNILKRMVFASATVTPTTSGTYYRYGDPTKWQSPDLLYRVTLPADYQAGVQYYSATEYPLWKK